MPPMTSERASKPDSTAWRRASPEPGTSLPHTSPQTLRRCEPSGFSTLNLKLREGQPMTVTADTKPLVGRELVLTRTFDAPRSLVFKAWIDPKHLAQWWGPKGFTNPVCDMDVRPGGAIRIVMRAPDDAPAQFRGDHPMTGVFREIVEPE